MKRGLIIIALCLMVGIGCKPKASVQQLTPSQAVAVQNLDVCTQTLEMGLRDTLNFGTMHQGEVINKSLRITNCDTKPIVLLRHVTSCGCVKVTYDRKPIAPSESTDINFEFDSKTLLGWQMKLMEFYFADKATPIKIYLEAEVE
jgi:hypothetical protein